MIMRIATITAISPPSQPSSEFRLRACLRSLSARWLGGRSALRSSFRGGRSRRFYQVPPGKVETLAGLPMRLNIVTSENGYPSTPS